MLRHDAVFDIFEVVLRRSSILGRLEHGVMDKRALVEELECSRSTVNRAIRELEALDLVAYVDRGYRITPLGKTVASGFVDLAETVALRLEFDPFLRWMPDDEFDLDPSLLRDAELLLPMRSDPYAMVNRHVSRLKEADDYQLLLPLTGLHAYEAAHESIVNDGTRGELVVAPRVAETLRCNPSYAPLTEEMVETGRLTIYVYDGEIPYFVGMLDGMVQIGADEDREPRAIVETANDEVRDWAEDVYEEYKRQAELVEIAKMSTQIGS